MQYFADKHLESDLFPRVRFCALRGSAARRPDNLWISSLRPYVRFLAVSLSARGTINRALETAAQKSDRAEVESSKVTRLVH